MSPQTAVLAESLPDLAGMPEPVRNRVGLELLYALDVLPRPADPEPDEDDDIHCQTETGR